MIAELTDESCFTQVRHALGPLREFNDLKRLYAYNLGCSSFATWIFNRACEPITSGQPLLADRWCAATVAAARLGAITPHVLKDVGLDEAERFEVYKKSILVHQTFPTDLLNSLINACEELDADSIEKVPTSALWVERLVAAPRAGATCPGKPRIALEPPEIHSDHCAMVAVYGYLLADIFGADREDAWLIGLCHHFHNAYLPDSGFTGEIMLGAHLARVIDTLRTRVICELPECYRTRVTRLFEEIDGVTTPLAKTFHAADTIDRIVQMEHYERTAQFKVRHALVDLNLVHEGAAQAFQHALLKSTGLFVGPIE